ncbi:MAG: NRDE family protein [Myxococcota bacterium]
MCLIVLAHRAHRSHALIVAANRDERGDRPTESMQILTAEPPRIVGGRDLLAGGTWMAINENGVIAGVTNQRSPRGRDGSKRSRGEIPLDLARCLSASEAAVRAADLVPGAYNPCTLLVADEKDAFYVELITGEQARVVELEPGVHVLENRALTAPSPKADRVRSTMEGYRSHTGDALLDHLERVLADQTIPEGGGHDRPPQLEAARVSLDGYGTRSSTLVLSQTASPPTIWYIDGPPGETARRRFSGLVT